MKSEFEGASDDDDMYAAPSRGTANRNRNQQGRSKKVGKEEELAMTEDNYPAL